MLIQHSAVVDQYCVDIQEGAKISDQSCQGVPPKHPHRRAFTLFGQGLNFLGRHDQNPDSIQAPDPAMLV